MIVFGYFHCLPYGEHIKIKAFSDNVFHCWALRYMKGVNMAGNAWKYSGVLDDYDLAFLQHDFITIKQGVEYYGFSERPFLRMAKEAGAYYKIGKMVRVNRAVFDAYLREQRRVPRIGGKLCAKS